MDYCIKDIPNGKQVVIDLPLEITCMNFSFTYYDEEAKEDKSSGVGSWVVDDGEDTPKNFHIPVREFKKVTTAVAYAHAIYVKYLKSEIKRVKGCDM